MTYKRIIQYLNHHDFERYQYSGYRRPDSDPIEVWEIMLQLMTIEPPGKLQSTVLGLKMHYVLHEMDVTEALQFGGVFSPFLLGPTPAGLIDAG